MDMHKGRAVLTSGDWEASDPGSLRNDQAFEPTTPESADEAPGPDGRRTARGARLRELMDEQHRLEVLLQAARNRHREDGGRGSAADLAAAEADVQRGKNAVHSERLRLGL